MVTLNAGMFLTLAVASATPPIQDTPIFAQLL